MSSSTPLYVEVNGHFHFLASVHLGKDHQYSMNGRLGVFWSHSGWFRKQKNLFSVLGVEP